MRPRMQSPRAHVSPDYGGFKGYKESREDENRSIQSSQRVIQKVAIEGKLAGAIDFLKHNTLNQRAAHGSKRGSRTGAGMLEVPNKLHKGKSKDKHQKGGKQKTQIKYKFQKLTQNPSNENQRGKEIQINRFKYILDITNREVMSFLGLAGSGSTDMGALESKKQYALLMKQDKQECEFMERKDNQLEGFGIGRASKKSVKKFIE